MIDRLYHIVVKNFLMIFRNWTSFILLILGPFFLVIIVGLILGSASYNSVAIGIIGESHGLDEIIDSRFILHRFDEMQKCLDNIVSSSTVLCIDFSDESSVNIVYDNSKLMISQGLMGVLTNQLGLTSDSIALESAQAIFSQIASLETFLRSANSSVTTFERSNVLMLENLQNFIQELNETKSNFDPTYQELLSLHDGFDNQSLALIFAKLDSDIEYLQAEIDETKEQVAELREIVQTQNELFTETREIHGDNLKAILDYYNNNKESLPAQVRQEFEALQLERTIALLETSDFDEIAKMLDTTLQRLEEVEVMLDDYVSILRAAQEELPRSFSQLESITDQATQIYDFISFSQEQTSSTISQISANKDSISSVQDQITEVFVSIREFSSLDAGSIINPFTTKSSPFLESVSRVSLYFPVILPLIILFLSVLFSNIIILNEIYSSAQLRNFILPIKDSIILLGFFITNLIIIIFQVMILIIFMHFQLDISLLSHIVSIFAICVLLSGFFILIGMIIAYMTHTKENSILLSTFISIGFFLFSSFLVELEMLSPIVAFFVALNPVVISKEILRQIVLFDIGFFQLWFYFFQILIYVMMLCVILYVVVLKHREKYH